MEDENRNVNTNQNNSFATPIAIIIAGLLIASAVFYTNGNKQNTQNETGGVGGTKNTEVVEVAKVKVSTDNDPVLGNTDAPITVIEFSDYECPFCQRSFLQMFPQLKSEYIDTGKVKLVFRDMPLPFHDPVATDAAIAANCAREQGGDNTYYSFHDEYFTQTRTNAEGVEGGVEAIAQTIGLDMSLFNECIKSGIYAQEVNGDIADAQAVGANGTPAYFIGYSSSDGIIEGEPIKGAQPYNVFKSTIDALIADL